MFLFPHRAASAGFWFRPLTLNRLTPVSFHRKPGFCFRCLTVPPAPTFGESGGAVLVQSLETRGAGGLGEQQRGEPLALCRVEQFAFPEQLLDHALLLRVLQRRDGGALGVDPGKVGHVGEDRVDHAVAMCLDRRRALGELGEEALFRLMPALRLRGVESEVARQAGKVLARQRAVGHAAEHADVDEHGKGQQGTQQLGFHLMNAPVLSAPLA